jgi:hypothetical protein
MQGGQHFPQALGVNRLDSGLRARAEEGFKPLVSERDNHRLYICALQSIAHDSQARVGLGRLLDTCFVENPRLNLRVPHAQQIERTNPVMLLGSRARLVSHDLRRDSGRAFYPFRQRAKRAAQAVNRHAGRPAAVNALLCMMRGS